MRLAQQTVICWCVFTTVLPLVRGATVDLNSSLKKRFRLWLQNRMRRDLRNNGLVAASDGGPDISDLITQQEGNTEAFDFQSSFGLNRSKRSGCFLPTCVVHDLYHRLAHIKDQRKPNAPEEKITSNGYGRRRRRSVPELYARSALQVGREGPSCSHGAEHTALPSLA